MIRLLFILLFHYSLLRAAPPNVLFIVVDDLTSLKADIEKCEGLHKSGEKRSVS
jgi:hypothetical protein